MAESRRYGLGDQLDIEQILIEAQHRWLRPAEICEILRNYKKFRIAPQPANMPASGSLFLFDRKVLRYFRKDGHNWRKKKDGKTVKEAHERLKAGSIDVLHCYYAHGEENENFQRRSYWMLEEDLSHIVLVHYREVKGNRTNLNRIRETEEAIPYSHETEDLLPNSEIDSSGSCSFHPNNSQVPSQTTDTTSLNSAQASEYEDAESAYNHQARFALHSFHESQQPMVEKINAGLTDPHFPASVSNDYQGKSSAISGVDFVSLTQANKAKESNNTGLKDLDFVSWEDVFENGTSGSQTVPLQPSFLERQPDTIGVLGKRENQILGQLFTSNFGERQEFGGHPQVQEEWKTSEGKWPLDRDVHMESEQDFNRVNVLSCLEPCLARTDKQENFPMQDNLQGQLSNAEHGYYLDSGQESKVTLEGKTNNICAIKPLLDGSLAEEGLKKLDSFNRWMSKELGDVNESHMQSSSGAYWDSVEGESRVDESSVSPQVHLDNYTLGPSLSQDQLFSIIDFSPNWAYEGSEIKVLITGRFLKNQQEAENCEWSCMFGEVEVPAEVIADGVLRCHTPIHKAARVPFYVTRSNRLACSEVREFEYRFKPVKDLDIIDDYSGNRSEILKMRFGKLLCLSSASPPNSDYISLSEESQLSNKISSLLKEDDDDWHQMLELASEKDYSPEKVQEKLLEKLLKEKLHIWLLQKAAEGGKGPSVLDKGGQGVLHFAAALGYDWAIQPTKLAGVSVNFRDVNGWTALHWAAFCGRERTVASLVSLGAAPGVVTDPCPKYPSGRTPADLASAEGHKGIAGYLAESALSAHLSSLKLDTKEGDATEISGAKAVQTVSERSATPISDGDLPDGLSLKDSLAAVCNATQAAARIHQVYRMQSFQKKQLKEYGDDAFGMSEEEQALSFLAVKTHKLVQHDLPVHAAAIRIQNKYRSWKGRKEFLIFRQRIVKIQAHVRGHQVRKNYKKITWSVGILEKVILRWRRKGSGLRGFKSEALTEGRRMEDTSSKEDDYDFLKEGRKQTEQRLQKALARVKSMVQYPEARDQYRRLLNVVAEIQETKVDDRVVNGSEETGDFDDGLRNLEELLDQDTDMPTAM